MNSRYYAFGGVASVCLHALLLVAFVLCKGGRPEGGEVDAPDAEASVPPRSGVTEEVPKASAEETADLSVRPASPVQSEPREVSASSVKSKPAEYRVRKGDTLASIARRFGCSAAQFAEANNSDMAKLSRLRIGQRLILPEGATLPAASESR